MKSGKYKKLGKITSEGATYNVLSGCTNYGDIAGLGSFDSGNNVGYTMVNIGFLGCATEEIAKHFGEYFGMLIIEAMYEDIIGLKYYFN